MKSNFWFKKRVLVTGGAGFIGSHVTEKLVKNGALVTILDHITQEKLANVQSVKSKIKLITGDIGDINIAKASCLNQDIVINMAARVGGIQYNIKHQGSILRENNLIACNMLEGARTAKVERFLQVSSACVYPANAIIPTPESEGTRDEPEPTNGGYGWGKRMGELLCKYYSQQYGMKIGIVRPYNCYGPRDRFDPKISHVIPALIKRIFDGEDPLIVWGSGQQTRAFLYVEDLAEGILLAAEKYAVPDPINLGTDEEISMKELINLILAISNKERKLIFDTAKPDGSPRRNSDNSKAKEKIGFKAKIKIRQGLKETIKWYLENNSI
ncbi:MAG: NAD-dependent epimerase/dehydratase family protein [Candidatus Daviesbacteria bacterium]|nr:NAD-dependent epimerase/dehydratase family protein [Candidatus Daviesbacteria bacterium]